MSKIKGTLIYLRFSSVDVVGLTEKTLSVDADMLECTDQQSSGGWREYLVGNKGGTINVSGIYDDSAANGNLSEFTKLTDGTSVSFWFGEKTTGERYLSGTAYVSNYTVNGPLNDPASFSFTLTITGKPSIATV
nr:hypothetical protein 4 [bacterium]